MVAMTFAVSFDGCAGCGACLLTCPTHAIRPTTARPATAHPTTAQPATARPATAHPTTAQPATARPATAHPTMAQPAMAQPTTAPSDRPAVCGPAPGGPAVLVAAPDRCTGCGECVEVCPVDAIVVTRIPPARTGEHIR